ncbi:hypothetical protein [Candidatus Arsenophonus triatominarum]|uniref:hypothetical protein n=1 Tax=Candidatus Arsenophonus triatominarum TaxID=57911 RepID=UPI0007C432D8|nr:hypothetical protein [Candidatus Arsenophonus triatominarum]
MAVLVDFDFDDKHDLKYYGIINPSERMLHRFTGNKLIITSNGPYSSVFGVNIEDASTEKEIIVTLKNAKGRVNVGGVFGSEFVVDNEEPKTVSGKITVLHDEQRFGDIGFIVAYPEAEHRPAYLEFTGYKIEI